MSHTAEIEVRRHWFTTRSTIGALLLDGGDCGFCLEPATTAKPPCVPAGRYPVTRYMSPKFSREVLLLHDVPKRDMIEMHVLNFGWQTQGCLGPGLTRGDNFVGHSEVALDALLRKLDGAERIAITILDDPWVSVA